MVDEVWVDVLGFEDHYQISSMGRLRSLKGITNSYVGRILTPGITVFGYEQAHLYKNNVRYVRSIHDLVAEAFIGPRPDGCEIHHKDNNTVNNAYTNLQYVTREQNISLGYITGNNRKGENHEWAIYTDSVIKAVFTAYKNGEGGYKKLGIRFNMPWGTIRNIVKGRRRRSATEILQ